MVWFALKPRLSARRTAIGATVIGLALATMFAPAQTPPTPAPATLALFNDIDDINKLRVLNPLKLTPDQLNKLAEAIAAAKIDYDKKATDLAVAPIAKLAGEIHTTKRNTLKGDPIPKEFDDKIKNLQDDFIAKRDELNVTNWKSLIAKSKEILTADQVATAIKLEKATKPADVEQKSEDDRWFNVYVLNVFINYPRIVPLLKEMKAAQSG